MFFITNLKDYIDHLNNLTILLNENFTFFIFFKSFFIYLYKSILFFLSYIFSFHWFFNFIELPAILKYNYRAIIEGYNIFDIAFQMELNQNSLFFEATTANSKNILTGIINSFFLSLPLSIGSFLSIRAFLINGLPAGIFSASGTIIGQILFFSFILFGFEFFLIPFLYWEIGVFLFGFFFIINIVFFLVHKPNMFLLSLSQKKELIELFKINFILAFFEQTCIFSYFGNFNLLQTNLSQENFFFNHFNYLLGLFIGTILWTIIFGFIIAMLRNFITNSIYFKVSFINCNQYLHAITLITITILCFINIPYYGFDYLFYGPLGFIYEDKILEIIKPKMIYGIKFQQEKKKIDYYVIARDLPFDKPYIITDNDFGEAGGILKYEHYTLLSERFWKNKDHARSDLMKQSEWFKQIKNFFYNSSNILAQKKQTTTIELGKPNDLYDGWDLEKNYLNSKKQKHEKQMQKELPLEQLLSTLFRNDIYYSYKNNKTLAELEVLKRAQAHRTFREKYLTNPIYKIWVNIDMKFFFDQQPKILNLMINDDIDLFQRRIILQQYLHSTSYYKDKIKTNAKYSYAEKVYNQQFKGSLNHIRHYNAIKLNYNLNNTGLLKNTSKVLKFDQILFNEFSNQEQDLLHEEINFLINNKIKQYSSHKKNTNEIYSPYLVLTNTSPFYIGWDNELHKFLVQTANIPNLLKIGDEIDELVSTNYYTNELKNKKEQYFSFQSWSPNIKLNKTYSSSQNLFKLPGLWASSEEIQNLKNTLEFLEDEDKTEDKDEEENKSKISNGEKKEDETENGDDNQEKNISLDDLLKRSQNYNWNWKKTEIDTNLYKYLELGDVSPPQLDGIAWPGINNKLLFKKVIQ